MRRQANTFEGFEGFSYRNLVCLVLWFNTSSIRSMRLSWMYGVSMSMERLTISGESESISDCDSSERRDVS